MSNKACDYLMRLQIPQEDAAIVTSSENLLPIGTQGQIMNAVTRRMPPGGNRFFHIAVPDLDFPLGTARYDLAIDGEQAGPDGAAVWKGANQLMRLRLPEPSSFVCARREDVVAIGIENDLTVAAPDTDDNDVQFGSDDGLT